MNMDSSSAHHQNWLGFSLSNHHQHMNINNIPSSSSATSSSDSSHLSLFEAFITTPTTTDSASQENTVRATDLSIFANDGPKLEDFLGGSTTAPPPPAPAAAVELAQLISSETPTFSGESANNTVSEIYESELKSIAASFLRGFATSSTFEQADVHINKQQLYNNNNQNQEPHHHYQNQTLIQTETAPKKTADTFGQRTSIYRGVTRHRWTGRYEAHLWDNSCRREGQSRKGRQVYLGGYDKEEKAARAYDLAALKYWGPTTTTNFPICNYEKELEEMKHMTRQEFVASLRRKSSGFSRGASIYRGVTRHHQHGRWQARIGRVAGNKDLYLGTFSTQEEAAEAYDIAAIKFRGLNAVTNFDMSRYDVKSIANSNLPIGGISGKSKNSSESAAAAAASDGRSIEGPDDRDLSSASSVVTFGSHQQPPTSTLSFAIPIKQDPSDYWSILGYQNNATALNNAKTATLFPSPTANGPTFQSPTTFSMDFHANSSANESNNSNNTVLLSYNNAGGYAQQQESGGMLNSSALTSIPFATPIALNSAAGGSRYEGNSGYGGWIAQSLHSLQSAKPNLSVFQTPIFGME